MHTGIISSTAVDKYGEEYVVHPYTNQQIVGFKIPHWQECKSFVEKIARVVPTVGYVGWDIVVQDNGEFALIEGNDNADHDVQQIHQKPMWRIYKSTLKNMC